MVPGFLEAQNQLLFFTSLPFCFNCTIAFSILLFNQYITTTKSTLLLFTLASTCILHVIKCVHHVIKCTMCYHVLCRVQAQQETAVVINRHPPQHNLKVMVQPPVKERPKMLKMTRNEPTITSVRSNLLGTNL